LLNRAPDFSLVLGGPIFQLLRRSHLSNDALDLLGYRIALIALFCWLPLLALSMIGGRLFGGAAVPFVFDFEVHVRFLVVVPLFIAAELVVHRRMRSLVAHFLERRLIPESGLSRFEAALEAVIRLRNSVLAEAFLFVFVYVVGIFVVWRNYIVLDTSTWYANPAIGAFELTPAGVWLEYVSLPIMQFLLCRWYFRLFIWIRFLWQVSRIELSLIPTHPDRAAGLGFLSTTVYAFAPLLLAHGALLAGHLANRIYYLDATLPQFILEIAIFTGFLMCWVLGPLLLFTPQLAAAKRHGLRHYGALAEHYVRDFEAKWLRNHPSSGEQLLGSADIQSLADLGNSFEIIHSTRSVPFSKEAILQLALVSVIPIAPLLLTIMPVEELIKKLFGILF
jgi:hypothetical protein